MKISTTFEIVKQSLYSVQYDLYEVSEFRRLFDFWNNAEMLYEYFQENKKDLDSHFWKGISIPSAVLKTRNEANEFENKLFFQYGCKVAPGVLTETQQQLEAHQLVFARQQLGIPISSKRILSKMVLQDKDELLEEINQAEQAQQQQAAQRQARQQQAAQLQAQQKQASQLAQHHQQQQMQQQLLLLLLLEMK